MSTHMQKIAHQRDSTTKAITCLFCMIMVLTLVCTTSFADDQKEYSLEKALKTFERIKKKISNGEELSEEERKAFEILNGLEERSQHPDEKYDSTASLEKDSIEKRRYKTIEGTQAALGVAVEDDIICEQKLFDNKDGLTFTYMRRTREGLNERWVFMKNANPFYWANYWDNVDEKLKDLEKVENDIEYQLPPSKVLIELARLSKICPVEMSSITGTDIEILNTETVVPYWTNEEYFFTDSETTPYAAIVSLYYGKRSRQNKNNFAIIWPCYLKYREKK